MNLVVDVGNTLVKAAVFEGDNLLAFARIENSQFSKILNLISEYPSVSHGIISSVAANSEEIISEFDTSLKWLVVDHATAVPVRNLYSTPQTLGKDRLAGIVAAWKLFRGSDVLVIDAGTAVTYDLLTAEGNYLGGAISPGLQMRYKALHTFTGRLPLLDIEENPKLTGDSTVSSIHSGIGNGLMFEVEGFVNAYLKDFPALKIILTGGHMNYFDKQLKVKTFAAPNLVLEGLNTILNYNLENKQV
ncbi:MAG: type III pantothenate kinase [Bacteroidales bacterium]|nr:type III pantothenate kinase [Bacteroidales bacterium]